MQSHGYTPVGQKYSCTKNFVWNISETLGRGATAIVYKARNKESGEVCAVKVFHDRVSSHHASVPERELELLLKLKHRNIITILGREKELNTNNDVIAMEYCSGGSLYAMLDKPKFSYGFPEEEYLIVLHDISEGMRYLRICEITHRDIKPGNIMRKLDENGGSVYQLTDFGAARSLHEEEMFTSIYGTEEYLDPNMYEKAVLRQSTGIYYSADVDLWSLGVTLYHVATGSLPFIPYGGRSNSKTMHYITTKKKTGVISGIQRTEGGDIEWRTELPRTCALSQSLKLYLTPMLAGLLESNTSKRWTFDQFFHASSVILNKLTLKIFDCSSGICNKLYIDKHDRYATFQELVAKTTDIAAGEQLILYTNRELCEIIELTKEVQQWPKSILHGQLFLYQKEKLDQQRLVLPEIPPLPQFSSKIGLDRDCYVAHKMAAITCLIVRYTTYCLVQQEMMISCENQLRDYILRITRRINNSIPDMCRLLDEHKRRQQVFYDSYTSLADNFDVIIPFLPKDNYLSSVVTDKLKRIHEVLKDTNPWTVLLKAESRANECKVYMDVLMQKIKEQEDEAISNCVGCLEEDHCLQKAEYISSKVCDIHLLFQKQKKERTLCEEEQFSHDSDRSKLMDYCVQIVSLLQSHCLMNLTKVYNVVGKQITLLLKNLQRTKKVDQNITSVNECREKLSNRMDRMEKECKDLASQTKTIIQSQIKDIRKFPESKFMTEENPSKERHSSGYGSGSGDSGKAASSEHIQSQISKSFFRKPLIDSESLQCEAESGLRDSSSFIPGKSLSSLSNKLENEFQELNKESLTVQRELTANADILKKQSEMVDQLLSINITRGSQPTSDDP